MRIRTSLATALAALVGSTLGLAGPAAPAQAAPSTHTVLSFNLCNAIYGQCHSGAGDNAAADVVTTRIFQRADNGAAPPKAVLLQEACQSQVARIREKLRTRWPAYNSFFKETRTGAKCRDGSAYGIATVYLGALHWQGAWKLPEVESVEDRYLQCVRFQNPTALVVCNTHLDHHWGTTRTNGAQVKWIAAELKKRADVGLAPVAGGDFNRTPSRWELNPIYNSAYGGGATGVYNEAAGLRGGAATHDSGKKLDYVFFHRNRFTRNHTWVEATGTSDHRLLWTILTLDG